MYIYIFTGHCFCGTGRRGTPPVPAGVGSLSWQRPNEAAAAAAAAAVAAAVAAASPMGAAGQGLRRANEGGPPPTLYISIGFRLRTRLTQLEAEMRRKDGSESGPNRRRRQWMKRSSTRRDGVNGAGGVPEEASARPAGADSRVVFLHLPHARREAFLALCGRRDALLLL